MTRWRRNEAAIAATALLVLLAGRTAVPANGDETDEQPEIVIVTHTSIPLESVSRKELAQVFLGVRTSIGSVRLNPINLGSAGIRHYYLERLTGMSRARIEEHYIALVLRGEGKRPLRARLPSDVPRLAFETKNIVAWLTRSQYDGLTSAQQGFLKILAVDDKRPGEPAYLFRQR